MPFSSYHELYVVENAPYPILYILKQNEQPINVMTFTEQQLDVDGEYFDGPSPRQID